MILFKKRLAAEKELTVLEKEAEVTKEEKFREYTLSMREAENETVLVIRGSRMKHSKSRQSCRAY